jgi:hypothetical protein
MKMTIKTREKDEKDITKPESKPEKLAKLIFAGIKRYIKAQNAQNGEKNYGRMLDFSRERRVNRHTDIDQ